MEFTYTYSEPLVCLGPLTQNYFWISIGTFHVKFRVPLVPLVLNYYELIHFFNYIGTDFLWKYTNKFTYRVCWKIFFSDGYLEDGPILGFFQKFEYRIWLKRLLGYLKIWKFWNFGILIELIKKNSLWVYFSRLDWIFHIKIPYENI